MTGKVTKLRFALLIVFVGVSIGLTLWAQSKNDGSALDHLASAKADVSRLEWAMLRAEVSAMREDWSVSTVGIPRYGYDKAGQVLFANVFTNTERFKTSTLDDVRKELQTRGMLYCALLGDADLAESLKAGKIKCQVNFISYAGGSPKLLAKYDSARLSVTFN